jgi:EF-P beta-lysylation protein EpmB
MAKSTPFFTSLKDLFAFLELPEPSTQVANSRFSFLVSHHFASKIEKNNPNDPLLREILPTAQENLQVEGFCDDPVGDSDSEKEPGILQKYKGRVLIEPTFACSLHCRFCFRRAEPKRSLENFLARFDAWLSQATDIHEVILSGGDPMMLPKAQLAELFQVILSKDHVKTVRIHTRTPISFPQVFDIENKASIYPLLQKLSQKKKLVVVVHVDHPNELDDASAKVFAALQELNAILLNQSTLLKGINDSGEVLTELSFKLFSQGVLPYYLHQLDHATGVAHFEISDAQALQIVEEVRQAVPGYLVPRLVREIAGEASKTPIVNPGR